MVKAQSSLVCLGYVGGQETGTPQEDAKIAFIYNVDTQDCKVGRVPLQLVKVVKEKEQMEGIVGFIDNGSSEKLYICLNCMTGTTFKFA